MVTKTIGKLHFSDLEPGRFEMLTMLMIYRMRRWEKINHFGAAGSDDGIDIEAIEILENGKKVIHHFQCKRYEKLNKNQLIKIVKDYQKKNQKLADYYYIVCGCNISKKANDGFIQASEELGIKNSVIWTASYIETMLFTDCHDILFAFFGVNMTDERNNTIAAIRRNVALKKRMHNELLKDHYTNEELYAIRHGSYWKKFKHTEILIRSIYDKSYPCSTPDRSGFFKTEVYNWYHNGLEVRTSQGGVTAKIKRVKSGKWIHSTEPNDFEIVEEELDEFGQIPYERIVEFDVEGDEFYRFPHLYCDYPCGSNPYEAIVYRYKGGYPVKIEEIIEIF